MTPEEIISNRQAAIATVRAQMGLSNTPSDWTYEQRVAYDKALAAYILANSSQFDATEISIANSVSSQTFSPLEDASFDWGAFGTETFQPLADAAQSVGSGILTVANAAKWAIPALVVVGIILFFEKNSARDSFIKKVIKR
ncbi:MAG TPA: hypothetical protein VL357_01635 [Rariglobus sp.]|jgi:hypothetical protein|nr:hypothetical protein [Rariglobus sp.]